MVRRIVQQSKATAFWPLIRSKEQSGATSSIFNCRYSVFFWHLLLLEQMTKEVPGIRPAVISTETGTRLDEYRRFRHVVRNVYTHSFDPAKRGKLVNSASELCARAKAELLAFAAFLEHERVILKSHLPMPPIFP
jgi:hypothetical protein